MDRREYDLALSDFTRAVELQPENANFYLHRSMAYDRKGEVDRVIDDLNAGLRLDKATKDEYHPLFAQAHRNRANRLLKRERYSRAVREYGTALKYDPDYAAAYQDRGTAHQIRDKLGPTIADYTEVLRLKPEKASLLFRRGVAALFDGDNDGAIDDLSRAIELEPQNMEAYHYRGSAYVGRGDDTLAIRDLDRALELDAEVSARIGAEHGERSPDRLTYRNGYRTRQWDTRVGMMELRIPKPRKGSYFPSLLEPRRRSEKALLAEVQQAYVEGASTRRVDDLVKALGCDGISKSQVSRICGELDRVVGSFLDRFPDGGPFWLSFLRSLVARGLNGVDLVTSDGHQGPREAIATVFGGSSWQRCRTHFMTNLLTKVSKSAQP